MTRVPLAPRCSALTVALLCALSAACASAVAPDARDVAAAPDVVDLGPPDLGIDAVDLVDARIEDEPVVRDTPDVTDVRDATDTRRPDSECDPGIENRLQCLSRYGPDSGFPTAWPTTFRCCDGRCIAATTCGNDAGAPARCGAADSPCDFRSGVYCCHNIDTFEHRCARLGEPGCGW